MANHAGNSETKRNIPLRIAAVLLCLTLLSTYLVSGLLARYSASGESGDGARVAKFSIEGGELLDPSQSIAANLMPGEFDQATIQIQNNSEVAVKYTITVTNETKNLPLEFSMEKKAEPSAELSEQPDGTYTAQQLPGGHTDEYTLSIRWNEANKDPALMGMVDHITVTVTAAQID